MSAADPMERACECGCGAAVTPPARFLRGHNLRKLDDDAEARRRAGAAGNLVPGAGAWQPGATTHLTNGLRTRRPNAIVLSPLVAEIEAQLAQDLPLQAVGGGPLPPDGYAVELAAISLLRVRRVSAYLDLHGDTDEKGRLRAELDGLGKATEQAFKALDRLGMTPRARAALGFDLARTAATVDAATALSEPDPERRRALMRLAGLPVGGDGERG